MKRNLFALLLAFIVLPGCLFKKDGTEIKAKPKKKVALDQGKGIPLTGDYAYDEGAYFDPEVEKFALGEDDFEESRELSVAHTEEPTWRTSHDTDLGCETLYFDFDSDAVSGDQKGVLAYDVERVKKMTEKENTAVTLKGHSDSHFISKTYNIAKSEKRAQRVKKELIEAGVEEEKIKVVAYGDMQPAVNTKGKERLNRRVEFIEVNADQVATAV